MLKNKYLTEIKILMGEKRQYRFRKYFVEKAFHACEDTKFELAKLGNDAGIDGGVELVLNI
jgi:glucokinase